MSGKICSTICRDLGKTVFVMPKTASPNSPIAPLVIGLTQNPTPVCRCQTPQHSHGPTPSHQPATNQSAEPSSSPLGEPTNGTNGSTAEPSHEPTPSQTPAQPTEPSAQTAPNSTPQNSTQNPMPNIPPAQPQQPATPNLKALALEALIGPRGTVKPSSGRNGNKNLIKKWLTEKGVAFSVSGYATVKELGAAYNDITDVILNSMIQKSQTSGQQTPNQQTQQTPSAPTAQPTTPQTPSVSVPTPKKTAKPMKHALHNEVVEVLSVGLNAFVFGPAGSGKTTLASSVAESLGLRLFMTGAVRKDFKLFGFIDAHGNYRSTTFRDAFENGGLFLFDEIDASDSGVLLQLNAALANGVCDFPDKTIKAHPDFRVMASANTNGDGATASYSARQLLDGASKDRFMVFTCDYDNNLVKQIVTKMCGSNPTDLAVCLDWNEDVCLIRKLAKANSISLILSPRATFMGVKLLTNPNRTVFKTKADLMDGLVWNKLSDENTRKRLKSLFEAEKAKAVITPAVTA